MRTPAQALAAGPIASRNHDETADPASGPGAARAHPKTRLVAANGKITVPTTSVLLGWEHARTHVAVLPAAKPERLRPPRRTDLQPWSSNPDKTLLQQRPTPGRSTPDESVHTDLRHQQWPDEPET